MATYIFGARNGIHIIDLEKTVKAINKVTSFLSTLSETGAKVLFVGTKKQAKESIEEAATNCEMPFVNERWLGGMLTNFTTIRKSISKLEAIEKMEEDGTFNFLKKKEIAVYQKEKTKLTKVLRGIRNMTQLPGAIFIIDPTKENLALHEASLLGIPIIALTDTNADPDRVDFPIPGNDDAIRAVKLICDTMTEAIKKGRKVYLVKKAKEEEEARIRAEEEAKRKAEEEAKRVAEEEAKKAEEAQKSEAAAAAKAEPAKTAVPEPAPAPESAATETPKAAETGEQVAPSEDNVDAARSSGA